MKKIILPIALITLLFGASCNDNGNTGNGANDPTAEFEKNNIKDPEDARLQNVDTTRLNVDTTNLESKHY